MKIRTGYVSNSSSSSFVLIVDKQFWDTEVSKLNEDQKKVVNVYCSNTENFKDMIIFNWMTGNNGDYIWEEIAREFEDDENPDEKRDEMMEWFDDFVGELEKNKDKVKSISVDC